MAVNATAVWRVRPSGNNLNGGGYDSAISGAGTDYSQQNVAQATGTNGATSGAGSTTFTDATAGAFTSAMVGNCIQIASGTNFQAGFYFVTAFTNANSVVLDRTPTSGGAGSAGVWKLGGGWADFWTNTTSTGPVVAGNIIYILGVGTPNPAAYTYDYDATVAFTPAAFNDTRISFANDPGTPGYKAPPDTTGGMPVIKFHVAGNLFTLSSGNFRLEGLYFVGTTTAASKNVVTRSSFGATVFGCVLDDFGFDVGLAANTGGDSMWIIGCEVFSSVVPGAAGSMAAISNSVGGNSINIIIGCNIHDVVGVGIYLEIGMILNTIVAKCQSDGIKTARYELTLVQNCTIDGNLGSGIVVPSINGRWATIFNNVISNHTTAGKYGINAGAAGLGQLLDYNVFYNNTADLNNLSYGPHDTHGGANPYVGSATENYSLA